MVPPALVAKYEDRYVIPTSRQSYPDPVPVPVGRCKSGCGFRGGKVPVSIGQRPDGQDHDFHFEA